jgi:hypothetical protein
MVASIEARWHSVKNQWNSASDNLFQAGRYAAQSGAAM